MRRRDHLEDLDMNGRIVRIPVLRKQDGKMTRLALRNSGGPREHSN